MKKIILASAFLFFLFGANAQKIKQTGGKLAFLKGQTELSVSFVYSDDMKVGNGTEQQYIDKKMAKADEDEPGNGKKWLKAWKADRTEHFQPKFIELFNDVMQDKDIEISENNEAAKYLMVVKTVFIEPGFNVGVARKNAYINLEICFVENGNPDNVLAEFTITKSPGSMAFGTDFDTGMRIGEAYAKAAKSFSKYLLKKKAF